MQTTWKDKTKNQSLIKIINLRLKTKHLIISIFFMWLAKFQILTNRQRNSLTELTLNYLLYKASYPFLHIQDLETQYHDVEGVPLVNLKCFKYTYVAHWLGMSYYVKFFGGLGSNEFHIKWIFGTHGSWKNQNSWGPFWSYQLNSTANLAHLAHFFR